MNYWRECIETAMEEADLKATVEQLEIITEIIKKAHENIGMMYPVPENPYIERENTLILQLEKEKKKKFCTQCMGKGRAIVNFFSERISNEHCHACDGSGKI